jgi:hypothetical protein
LREHTETLNSKLALLFVRMRHVKRSGDSRYLHMELLANASNRTRQVGVNVFRHGLQSGAAHIELRSRQTVFANGCQYFLNGVPAERFREYP